jgi:hypothetical protein
VGSSAVVGESALLAARRLDRTRWKALERGSRGTCRCVAGERRLRGVARRLLHAAYGEKVTGGRVAEDKSCMLEG